MNKNLLYGIFSLLLLFVFAFLFLKSPVAEENAPSVKIGVAIPLTGIAAIVGENERNGIELAVKQINSSGGVSGRLLQVIIEDDGTDASKSVSAVQKLINIDKVDALIGGTWDFLANAVVPVIDSEKKVMITPSTLPDTLQKTSPFLFITYSPVASIQGVVTRFLRKVQGNTVVTISVNNTWGQAHLDTFRKAIIAAGKSLAKEIVLPEFDNNDLQTQLSLIKPLHPDAIVVALNFGDSATFVKKKMELALSGVVLAHYNLEDEYAQGNIPKSLLNGITIFVFSDPEGDFVQKYSETYHQKPGAYADTAYDAVYVLKKAIENEAGKTDSNSIIAGLRLITHYQGASGLVDFSQNNYPNNKIPLLKSFDGSQFVSE